MFAILYPAGGTGGYKRQRSVIFNSVYKFGAFFYYRKVRGDIDIDDRVKPETAHRGDHFPLDVRSYRVPKFFSQLNSDRRSGSYNNVFRLVGESVPYFLSVVLFCKSSRRTYRDALSAGDTADF